PLVVRTVLPVLRAVDPRLREVAAVLGSGPGRVLRTVDLPIALRSVGLATGFAFAVALGEFGATSFLARPDGATLPGVSHRAARRGELRDGARGVGGAGGAHGDRDDGGGAAARRARRRGVLMAGLEVRDVTVRYGGTTAVDGASLAVAPGEVVALLGPSGCG